MPKRKDAKGRADLRALAGGKRAGPTPKVLPGDSGPKVRLGVYLDPEVLSRLDRAVIALKKTRRRASMTEYVADAIVEKLDRDGL